MVERIKALAALLAVDAGALLGANTAPMPALEGPATIDLRPGAVNWANGPPPADPDDGGGEG